MVNEYVLKKDESSKNCKNYKNNCSSQKSCVDKCFVSKYIKKFSNLPSNIPIYIKDNLKNFSFHQFSLQDTIKFKKMKKNCSKVFFLDDCYHKTYKPIIVNKKNAKKKIFIFLHNFKFINKNFLILNKQELLSYIITSINIWLGLSIPKLMEKFVFKFSRKVIIKFNFNFIFSSSTKNILQIISSLILFICLTYNLYLLTEETLKQSKVTRVKYELAPEIEYPFISFCLSYKKEINLTNHKQLNGHLLDSLTTTANKVFESISYLDENLKWKIHTDFKKKKLNKTSSPLQLSHFYLFGLKCFKLKNNVKIPFYHLYRKKNSQNFLTVKFKLNITQFYFTLGTNTTLNFQHFRRIKSLNCVVYYFRIFVRYEDLYASLKDLYYFFRKKTSVNFNEGVSYSNFIKEKFKESRNLTTLMLPLDEKYFDLTINDEEYLKFYRTEMVKLEKENYHKSFSADYFLRIYSNSKKTNKNQIKFKPKLISFETIIKDKMPLGNFILAVLNVSFWFNLSLMNIFEQLKIFFEKLYQVIRMIKIYIARKLNYHFKIV